MTSRNTTAAPRTALVMLLMLGAATLVLAADAFSSPERKYVSTLFVLVGMTATWRQYRKWQADR